MLNIVLNTKNKKVLCIGGGHAATLKCKTLVKNDVELIIVSPEVSTELGTFILKNRIRWIKEEFLGTSQLTEYEVNHGDIVLACTPDKETNSNIQSQARCLGMLAYRADIPGLSDFHFQATIHTDEFKVSISHNQADKHQSILLKNWIVPLLREPEFLPGQVQLVGFGPGAIDLMTLRAYKLIKQADVIFYDDLIGNEILDMCSATKIYVGKRKGQHYKNQDEINLLLLESAQNSNRVLRLKGGDPFIFGRGGEELQFLRKNGIEVKVVPGITSSLSASAEALTPLTHRGVSRRLTFMSAHHVDTELEEIPSEGTLVLYMGASKLEYLSNKLVQLGLDPKLKVALVYNASLEDQEIEILPINQLHETSLKSPLSIIIGEVVEHFNGN